jgi:hypothetical protein
MGGTLAEAHVIWDVRRVTEKFKTFHRSEHGTYAETVRPGDVVLVDRPGPAGYGDTERALAFTRLSSFLPPAFERCHVEVTDATSKTEVLGTFEGELPYGTNGAVGFPAWLRIPPTSARA